MYHSIGEIPRDPHHVSVTPRRLEQQLAHLKRRGLRGVSAGELVAATDEQRGRGLIGLTFDDGYRDYVTHALPALRRLGFNATLFALPGLLGRDNAWDRDGPTLPLVSADDVRDLAREGTEIGSHGMRHARLTEIGDRELDEEVAGSREALADVIGHRVEGFCYPYGDHDERVVAAVRRAGYAYGCAYKTHHRYDRHTLPRMHVGERDGPARLEAKLRLYDRVQRRAARASPSPSVPRPVEGDSR